MKRMAAGAFKARCLAVMKQVHATGQPVVVTKRGAPIVKVVPIRRTKQDDIFGFLRGELKILGDIESPIPDWEAERD
jgi:prevent-host-death family protein